MTSIAVFHAPGIAQRSVAVNNFLSLLHSLKFLNNIQYEEKVAETTISAIKSQNCKARQFSN